MKPRIQRSLSLAVILLSQWLVACKSTPQQAPSHVTPEEKEVLEEMDRSYQKN